jgi:D-aspartate ligase
MSPPVVLANANYYGTLAAARALGSQGVEVWLADNTWLGLSRWSSHVRKVIDAPAIDEAGAFLEHLISLGKRTPGAVLLPTSDETAYLYSWAQARLSPWFKMHHPGITTMLNVLDKKRLYEAAESVGLQVPKTVYPDSAESAEKLSRGLQFPVLIKPRTQLFSTTHNKGKLVQQPAEIAPAYRAYVASSPHDPAFAARHPDVVHPMVQQFLPQAASGIYDLSAFFHAPSGVFAARAARKTLQRPRTLGIGLCFEDAQLDEALGNKVRALFEALGHSGLLELEFVEMDGQFLLIDANPRLYNQLSFDHARGFPIARMMYDAAQGNVSAVKTLGERANVPRIVNGQVFCNRFGVEVLLKAQRLTGALSDREHAHWEKWLSKHRHSMIDPTHAEGDPLPRAVDVMAQVYGYLRHPRAFWRQLALDKS